MQWHQLGHMQTICTSLHIDNHINTPKLNFYRPDTLPDAQPTVSTQSNEGESSSPVSKKTCNKLQKPNCKLKGKVFTVTGQK